jgi:hypothetical protein
MAEETNDVLQEQPKEEQKHEVDESVRLIREISESKEVESVNFTPGVREKGDNFFRYALCYGLIAVGIIMIALAAFNKEYSNLFVGGVLFAVFGLFLDFLTRKIKKD